jgi:hypothetical protein
MASQANGAVETVRRQMTVFDLDTFDEITLQKVVPYTPVTSTAEALQRLGNDSGKFLSIINEGLKAEVRRGLDADPSNWIVLDDEGKPTDQVFTGTKADRKTVNGLVLTLAKTIFGFSKELTREQKATAKENAVSMIRNTDSIRNGLKAQAAKAVVSVEDAEAEAEG